MSSEKYTERSFIMVKPDGVQRGICGDIMARFEKKGYQLVACKLVRPAKDHFEAHYADLSSKAFFPPMIEYMCTGPVFAMVWMGKDIVKTGRKMLGATNPLDSAPGTIRGDFAIDMGRNICHGSDSVENAEKEISLWFPEGVPTYKKEVNAWIYE